MANRKAISVIKSVAAGAIEMPRISNKYWINELGRFSSPNCLFIFQCQSVRKQYPKPYFIPNSSHEANVSNTIHQCNLRVLFQIQPNKLKEITTRCIIKKSISRNANIFKLTAFCVSNSSI